MEAMVSVWPAVACPGYTQSVLEGEVSAGSERKRDSRERGGGQEAEGDGSRFSSARTAKRLLPGGQSCM